MKNIIFIFGVAFLFSGCISISQSPQEKVPPKNCIKWFDGCRECDIQNGIISDCTEQLCIKTKDSQCLKYQY